MKELLGIDVGATGIKGALVDLNKGQLISERIKYKTPKPSTQKAILVVIEKIIDDYQNLLINLDGSSTNIEEYLGVNELENDIDSQISYLERAITHLRQKIHMEKTS